MLVQLYRDYNELWQNGDQRVKDWPLMQTPLITILICLSYIYIVKVAGPRFMKNRKPMDIRHLMIGYNFTMVLASLYLFYRLGIHGWFGKYNLKCQPVDYSDHKDAVGMADIAWWYYISKFVEFFDTIFFVLRKKYAHISTLHVIHHGIMPMSVWWGVKFTPGGHSTFFAFVNSFIHVLMYSYYGIAAIGPHMYKYLWWKRYMTGAQMIQFMFIFIHSFQLIFRSCDYPRGFMWFIGFHAVMFWFLFWDFYKEEYHKKKDAAIRATRSSSSSLQDSLQSSIKSSSISSAVSRIGAVCSPDTTKLIHENGNNDRSTTTTNTSNNDNNNDIEYCIYTKNGNFTPEDNNNSSSKINNNNNNNYTNGALSKSSRGDSPNGATTIKNRSNCKDNFKECSLDATSKNHQDMRKNK